MHQRAIATICSASSCRRCGLVAASSAMSSALVNAASHAAASPGSQSNEVQGLCSLERRTNSGNRDTAACRPDGQWRRAACRPRPPATHRVHRPARPPGRHQGGESGQDSGIRDATSRLIFRTARALRMRLMADRTPLAYPFALANSAANLVKEAIAAQVVSLFSEGSRAYPTRSRNAAVMRSEERLFPPSAVTRRVHGDVTTMMVGAFQACCSRCFTRRCWRGCGTIRASGPTCTAVYAAQRVSSRSQRMAGSRTPRQPSRACAKFMSWCAACCPTESRMQQATRTFWPGCMSRTTSLLLERADSLRRTSHVRRRSGSVL